MFSFSYDIQASVGYPNFLSWQLFVNKTQIIDQPRFHYRGIMLDTARHFLPMPILLKNLVSMGKLIELFECNRIHCHTWSVHELIFLGCNGVQQIQRVPLAYSGRPVISVRKCGISDVDKKGKYEKSTNDTFVYVQSCHIWAVFFLFACFRERMVRSLFTRRKM